MPETAEKPRGLYEAPFTVERVHEPPPEDEDLPPGQVYMASQTLLSHIETCPYSGALYIKHKGGSQNPPMARGEAFHQFAEEATNFLLDEGELEMPPEVAKDRMQMVLKKRVDLNVPADEQDACRLMAWNWGASTMIDPEAIVGVEKMLELEVDDWIIRGKLDLASIANNDGIVEDYKTSKAIPTVEAYANSWQPQFYALLMAEGVPEGETVAMGQGLNGIHVKQLYPRYRREEDGQLVNRYEYYDRAHLHDFKETVKTQLAKLDHGLKTGEWAAQDGSHCRYCPARSECPIPPELRELKVIETADDALEVARLAEEKKRGAATGVKEVKAWVDDNGRLAHGDEFWDFVIERKETGDKDRIKAFLEQHGADPADFYKEITSTRFKKIKAEED